MRGIRSGCWACVASGPTTATLPRRVMNARRLTRQPHRSRPTKISVLARRVEPVAAPQRGARPQDRIGPIATDWSHLKQFRSSPNSRRANGHALPSASGKQRRIGPICNSSAHLPQKAAGSNRSKPHHYSITSSAATSRVGGISRPSALAVLRLMTSSNFVGCCTGTSAGLVPCRMMST
jgi:hypothetical protein